MKKGVQEWQIEWDSSTKGEITRSFFPNIEDRLSKKLQMCINLSTIVTGHGKLRSYFHRFKIIDDPTCPCKLSVQTVDHLLWECLLLNQQRRTLECSVNSCGGQWPISKSDLTNKYIKQFQKFIQSIDFEIL